MIRFIKRLGKALFLRFGYEVRAVPPTKTDEQSFAMPKVKDVNSLAMSSLRESNYYNNWSAPCPLFAPWSGHPDFQNVYEGVERYTLVSPDRCYILVSLARYAIHLGADFAECGVYKGGTALLLSRLLKNTDLTLYLFDSFKGLPKGHEEKDRWFREGQFAVGSPESVKELLSDFQNIIDIRQGWIPDTFIGLNDRRYAFVHIDVDLYQSALDCCKYFYSRVVPGGVIIFDEYGFPAARGEKDAVDEFFADKPEFPITLPTGQAMILKVPLL